MKRATKILLTIGTVGVLALTACGAADYEDNIELNVIELGGSNIQDPGIDTDLGLDLGITSGPALISPDDVLLMWSNTFDPATVQIIVAGEPIDAPAPFIHETALTPMLPITAIAEALGFSVVNNGQNDAGMTEFVIAPGTMLVEGENSYARGREAARELSTAPVIHDGEMFVPHEFFQEMLGYVVIFEDGNILMLPIE